MQFPIENFVLSSYELANTPYADQIEKIFLKSL